MNVPVASLFAAPYGLAFAVEDLLLVRQWAENRALALTVALDQVIDGAEFEEMLILGSAEGQSRSLILWRTSGTVFAQIPHSRPHAFATVADALESLRPAERKRAAWRKFLGLAG